MVNNSVLPLIKNLDAVITKLATFGKETDATPLPGLQPVIGEKMNRKAIIAVKMNFFIKIFLRS